MKAIAQSIVGSLFAAGFLASASSRAGALPLGGFLGFGYNFVKGSAAGENGSRTRYTFELGRLPKGVEFDFFAGTGLNYNDLGGILKLYRHERFFGEDNATGISFGVGGGVAYSDGNAALSMGKIHYAEILLSPFVRALYDSGYGVGLAANVSYELSPYRHYSGGVASESALKKRLIFGISLWADSRFIE